MKPDHDYSDTLQKHAQTTKPHIIPDYVNDCNLFALFSTNVPNP